MVENTAQCFTTVVLRTAGRSIMWLHRISFEDHGTESWVLDDVYAFFTCCSTFASKPWVTACMTPFISGVAWDRGNVSRCFLVLLEDAPRKLVVMSTHNFCIKQAWRSAAACALWRSTAVGSTSSNAHCTARRRNKFSHARCGCLRKWSPHRAPFRRELARRSISANDISSVDTIPFY